MRPLRLLLRLLALAAVLLAAPRPSRGEPRPPDMLDGAQLRAALRRLQVTGSVLYVGAHPDDDNTTLLAYLARGRGLRAAYLSLTRGDGGQNILGTETGEALGVLRTQELLASRRVDGAGQLFTRALDYGFSKSGDEALAFWGHERALADVTWAIRHFQPDVIVSRFGADGSGGHGHHTASAVLAAEAFRAAADSTRFAWQLERARPWQARRLVWNTFVRPGDTTAVAPGTVTLDDGLYDPLLGVSYPELGGRARSLNRSQGAGTRERRGPVTEAFRPVDGAPATAGLLDGVTLDWTRVAGGDSVAALLREAERRFDPERPSDLLPLLARAHAAIAALERRAPGARWIAEKRGELEEVLRSCAGLWLEAIAATPTVVPGDTLRVTFTALNRSPAALRLQSLEPPFGARAYRPQPAAPAGPGVPAAARPDRSAPWNGPQPLPENRPAVAVADLVLPADLPLSQPSWLRERALRGSFVMADSFATDRAEDPPVAVARAVVLFAGEPVAFEVPVVHRWTDRVYGDRYRALEVLPPATLALDQRVYLFPDARPREVALAVRATRGPLAATARLRLPAGWRAEPSSLALALAAGTEQVARFRVTPGPAADGAALGAEVVVGGRAWDRALQRIDYPHVPIQTLLPPCEARLVRTDLAVRGTRIAYLMGPGDDGPEALRQMGFAVSLLDDEQVAHDDLARFDCIVTGVRAYNTRPRLRALQARLLAYVRGGGRLVVQYCTNEDALNDRLGPWPFSISRDRVAVEDAPVRVLRPGHPLLRSPNAIGPRDFDGWVQERGLNYAGPWDPRYETVLSANDPGEPPRDGGLLYASYGRGAFVYTGLAFFRQLPAGVPGAWRLFANLVSRP